MHTGLVHNVPSHFVRERVPVSWDFSTDTLSYGADNLYPQRVEQVAVRSGLCVTALNVLTEFSQGKGFENEALGDQVANSLGTTWDEVLKFVAYDFSWFNAFALHVQYNLNFKISEVTPILSKYCRFATPLQGDGTEGQGIEMIRFSRNWEENLHRTGGTPREIQNFWVFDPNPEVVRSQMEASGGIFNFPGQILYATAFPFQYPTVIYDPVLDAVQTNGEIPLYELSNIQNGFHPSTIFKYPGKFEDEASERDILAKVRAMTGAQGAGSTLVIETPEDLVDNDLIETITVDNRDRMFEFTSRNNRESITQAFGTPPILLGFHPESGFVTQENMINSFNYYNQRTEHRRDFLSDQIEKVYINTQDAQGIDEFTIDPLIFEPTQLPPVVSPTGEVFTREGDEELIEVNGD